MQFRVATVDDIPAISKIRMTVSENVLRDPALATQEEVEATLTTTGRGWVAEVDGKVVGFAMVRRNGLVWALFVRPRFQGQGIGTALLTLCVSWLMELGLSRAFLDTGAGTKAEAFYRELGWREFARTDEKVEFEVAL